MINSDKVMAILKSKNVRSDCPMCSQKDWIVFPYYSSPIIMDDTQKIDFNAKSAQVQLICRNCGYIAQFNAAQIDMPDITT